MIVSERWWTVGTVATCAVVAALILLRGDAGDAPWLAAAAIGALVVAHLILGRSAIQADGTTASRAYAVVVLAAVGLATVGSPSAAYLQVIAYPLLWMLSSGFRTGALRSAALGVVVAAATGLAHDAWTAGIVTGAVSATFSIAMGAWFSSVYTYAEERAALVEELQRAQSEIAALERAAGTQDERARVAREIHDTIAQSLTGLVMVLQRSQRDLDHSDAPPDPAATARTLAVATDLAQDALAEARALVANYAPSATLLDSLTRVATAFERETGVRVAVTAAPPTLVREHEVVLLRTTQEALANVRKHANASRAWVTITADGGGVTLEVADDGVGPGPSPQPGYGLRGLADRAGLVGGWVELVAREPRGSVLRAHVPTAVDAS